MFHLTFRFWNCTGKTEIKTGRAWRLLVSEWSVSRVSHTQWREPAELPTPVTRRPSWWKIGDGIILKYFRANGMGGALGDPGEKTADMTGSRVVQIDTRWSVFGHVSPSEDVYEHS